MTNELKTWRDQLDMIDKQVANLLAERFRITAEVAKHKLANNMPLVDKSREAQIETKVRKIAAIAGLDPEAAVAVQKAIIKEATRKHREIEHNLNSKISKT